MLAEFARVLKPDGLLIMLSRRTSASTATRATTSTSSTCTSCIATISSRLLDPEVSRAALVASATRLLVGDLERDRPHGAGARPGSATRGRGRSVSDARGHVLHRRRRAHEGSAAGRSTCACRSSPTRRRAHEACRSQRPRSRCGSTSLLKERDASLAERTSCCGTWKRSPPSASSSSTDRELQIAEIQKVREERERTAAERERQLAAAIAERDSRIADLDEELTLRSRRSSFRARSSPPSTASARARRPRSPRRSARSRICRASAAGLRGRLRRFRQWLEQGSADGGCRRPIDIVVPVYNAADELGALRRERARSTRPATIA